MSLLIHKLYVALHLFYLLSVIFYNYIVLGAALEHILFIYIYFIFLDVKYFLNFNFSLFIGNTKIFRRSIHLEKMSLTCVIQSPQTPIFSLMSFSLLYYLWKVPLLLRANK